MSSQEKTFRDLKNREAPLTAIGSLQPRVQGLPQLWRPTWKHPLGPRTHQLLEASAHRLGGLDGVEKPFPLCVTCHPFLSPGQVVVYPPPQSKGASQGGAVPQTECPTTLGSYLCLTPLLLPLSPALLYVQTFHSTSWGLDLGACARRRRGHSRRGLRSHIHLSPSRRAGGQASGGVTLGNCCLFGFSQTCKNVALSKLKKKSMPPPTNDTISQACRAGVGRQIGL